ncbi:MAG: NAD-dependent epimerase/dehydratase family protein [Winogradskyella sp.]|nr:MAG: NAD-dependent epimerase/dehydratase family protein [Winogradskyella sp.]
MLRLSNIIISGITGFVGGNLKKHLGSTYSILGLSRQASLEENIQSYDKVSTEDLDNSKVFIHLAGKAHDLKKIADENVYFEVNTELTKSLFDKFLESNCEIFIFMSSVKAVADNVDNILEEETFPNPKTIYGKSKLAAENYILSKNIPINKKFYILRPCMIHGPSNKGNLNLLFNIINKGIPYPLGTFKNERSFLSVDNLSFVIQKLIEINPASGIYNVADDDSISTKELVKIIGEAIGKKAKVLNMPKGLIKLVAKIGDVLPLPLTTERLQKLTENYVVSNAKLKRALADELPLSTKEGIKKTIHSFKQ